MVKSAGESLFGGGRPLGLGATNSDQRKANLSFWKGEKENSRNGETLKKKRSL